MKNVKLWFVTYLSGLLLLNGCKTLPEVENCLIGDAGCICLDRRLEEGSQSYILTFDECRNYVARSIDSEKEIHLWIKENCK